MNPWTTFYIPDGRPIQFRRKHFAESFGGLAGVWALTYENNLAIYALQFVATDDLGDVDHRAIKAIIEKQHLGVAACFMPLSNPEERDWLAFSLNETLAIPREAA